MGLLDFLRIPLTDTTKERSPTGEVLPGRPTRRSSSVPEGSQWRAWRANTIHAIFSAAGRQDDLAQDLIMRVETDEPWQLSEPGEGWVSRDHKRTAASTTIVRGEIGREITLHSTTALNSKQVVRGRVLLAIVFRYYSSGANGQVLYDMNHLQTLTLHGDYLESFHITWNMVLSKLHTAPIPRGVAVLVFQTAAILQANG